MDVTRLGELTLCLGRQYLFVHQGDCEHALVFTACWLPRVPTAESAPRAAYPRLVYRRHEPAPLCSTCLRAEAAWQVHGDSLADVQPCRLCQTCHFQFHYTAEGHARRIDYRVYPVLREDAAAGAEQQGRAEDEGRGEGERRAEGEREVQQGEQPRVESGHAAAFERNA